MKKSVWTLTVKRKHKSGHNVMHCQLVINTSIVKNRGKGNQWCDYRMGRVKLPGDQLHMTICGFFVFATSKVTEL